MELTNNHYMTSISLTCNATSLVNNQYVFRINLDDILKAFKKKYKFCNIVLSSVSQLEFDSNKKPFNILVSGLPWLYQSNISNLIPRVLPPSSITFQTGQAISGVQNGFSFVRFENTGNYTFTMNNFQDIVVNFIVVGGGSGGQRAPILAFGGSGGSGAQIVYGSYLCTSNQFDVSARVGLGGIGSYWGNGGLSVGGTIPVEGGDVAGTAYGSQTTNDPENVVAIGSIKTAGGFSNLTSVEQFGTITALGGNVGAQTTVGTVNSCPNNGFSLGTGTTAIFYQGRQGGIFNATGNGITGHNLSVVGQNLIFGSSGGSGANNSGGENFNAQFTSGTNAGKASGSTQPYGYTQYSNPNLYDGFPASQNFGAGGGGASSSNGGATSQMTFLRAGVNYARGHGGNGGSGVIYLWW